MFAWAKRHPHIAWGFAWSLTSIGILLASSSAGSVPWGQWIGVLLGMLSWGVAGSATFSRGRVSGVLIWSVAFLVAYGLGSFWGNSFEHSGRSGVTSAGFVGALLGVGVGASLGGFVSTYLGNANTDFALSAVFGVAWGSIFFIGGYVAIVVGMFSAFALQGVGELGGMLGWALGAGLTGILAASIGMASHRAIVKPVEPLAV